MLQRLRGHLRRTRFHPSSRPAPRRALAYALVAGVVASGCAAWQPALEREGWTIYRNPGTEVRLSAFDEALQPAFAFVEQTFGPFERRVRIHAFHGAVDLGGGRRLVPDDPRAARWDASDGGPPPPAAGVQDVPGIGPARVQAFHASGGGAFARNGVFLGAPDAGTAVHELIHAWYADRRFDLPLWFEEGVATFFGDGMLVDGRWVVDGMAWWPLRELREEAITDEVVADLLSATPRDVDDVRRNVLVHFFGWAVVMDLHRETGSLDWRAWHAAFDFDDAVAEARRRLRRTLAPSTEEEWLGRLASESPEVRMATAQGIWKLRSRDVLLRLADALGDETHPEAGVCLAVNLLASAGELDLSWREWRRISQPLANALRNPRLADPAEREAARELYLAYRRGGGDPQSALRRLERYWAE